MSDTDPERPDPQVPGATETTTRAAAAIDPAAEAALAAESASAAAAAASLPEPPEAAAPEVTAAPVADEPAVAQPDNVAAGVGAALSTGAAGPRERRAQAQPPVRDCAPDLQRLFPALFGATPRPVKLRIQVDIMARAPGVFTRRELAHFFHRYTTGRPYLQALLASAERYDLDGQACGAVSEEHRQAAQTELDRRREVRQARIQAYRDAARAQRAARPAPPQADPSLPASTDDAGAPRRGPGRPGSEPGRGRHPQAQRRRGAAGTHAPPSPERRDGPESGRGSRGTRADAQRSAPQGTSRPPRGDGRRPQRVGEPPRNPGGQAVAKAHGTTAPTTERPPRREPAAPDAQVHDPARRDRAALLRDFETTRLSTANFCVLKRLTPDQLESQLAQARAERAERSTMAPAPPRRT
jgi:sRNA-binding protein